MQMSFQWSGLRDRKPNVATLGPPLQHWEHERAVDGGAIEFSVHLFLSFSSYIYTHTNNKKNLFTVFGKLNRAGTQSLVPGWNISLTQQISNLFSTSPLSALNGPRFLWVVYWVGLGMPSQLQRPLQLLGVSGGSFGSGHDCLGSIQRIMVTNTDT